MSTKTILLAACMGLLFTACNNEAKETPATTEETPVVTEDNTMDNETEEAVEVKAPVIQTDLDTSLLFQTWGTAGAPNAEFIFSGKSFLYVDSDEDAAKTYTLEGKILTIQNSEMVQQGEIISVTKDQLKIHWSETDETITYTRWKN